MACITTNKNYNLEELHSEAEGIHNRKSRGESYLQRTVCICQGDGTKVALLDLGAKRNIARSLNSRGCEVTVYPADTPAREILASQSGRNHVKQRPWRPEGM